MTTTDIAGLCERLRASHGRAFRLKAADTIERQAAEIKRLNATCYLDSFMASERKVERQAAEIERLRGALENADRRLSRPDWTVQRDTVRTAIRAALTGEDA